MHFIAFTCKEWKPNSLGRYGINSSASKTCFVTAMFAHMLRLIIQNRFHLLLKYFSIRNSLSDVPSAPLFVDAVSIFVACAVEFQVGVLAPEDFSVSNLPLRGLTIRRSCVCCSVLISYRPDTARSNSTIFRTLVNINIDQQRSGKQFKLCCLNARSLKNKSADFVCSQGARTICLCSRLYIL